LLAQPFIFQAAPAHPVARQQAFAEILEPSHLLMFGRSLGLRNSPQKQFSSKTPGRQLVGSFFELGRLFRKPLFKGVPVSNTLALLNHLDGWFEPRPHPF
jgi:hypothetical protein